jgi:hypothetical protein
MPALTSQSELAKEGIRHLQYPEYFGTMLVFFKVVGALVLIIPMIPARFKEWAYGCFAVELVCACWSHFAIDGIGGQTFFPLIVLGVLSLSYFAYHKMTASK